MDIASAIRAVKAGERVRRESWDDAEAHCTLIEGALCVFMDDKLYHPWTITEVDLYAYDWESDANDDTTYPTEVQSDSESEEQTN